MEIKKCPCCGGEAQVYIDLLELAYLIKCNDKNVALGLLYALLRKRQLTYGTIALKTKRV